MSTPLLDTLITTQPDAMEVVKSLRTVLRGILVVYDYKVMFYVNNDLTDDCAIFEFNDGTKPFYQTSYAKRGMENFIAGSAIDGKPYNRNWKLAIVNSDVYNDLKTYCLDITLNVPEAQGHVYFEDFKNEL